MSASGVGGSGFDPGPRHTKGVKNGTSGGIEYDKRSILATPPIRRGPFVDPTIIKLQF